MEQSVGRRWMIGVLIEMARQYIVYMSFVTDVGHCSAMTGDLVIV